MREFLIKLGIFNLDKVRKKSKELELLPPNLIKKTFIEEAKRENYKVYVKEFPGYNDSLFAEARAYLSLYFSKNLNLRLKKIEEIYAVSRQLFDEVLNNIEDNDLILYYTPLIDLANHMLYRPKKLKLMILLKKYYLRIDETIRELIENWDDKAFILILSDHGYDPSIHDHSSYGFWSSNIKIKPEPQTILDFKKIIMNFLEK